MFANLAKHEIKFIFALHFYMYEFHNILVTYMFIKYAEKETAGKNKIYFKMSIKHDLGLFS